MPDAPTAPAQRHGTYRTAAAITPVPRPWEAHAAAAAQPSDSRRTLTPAP